ncbi:MAG: hypothetical protein EPN85_11650 [Bacteroidetes bacterium]|nr:MAG: hypothetical protein EPN85_11650 [Bacteroidota bacterium]
MKHTLRSENFIRHLSAEKNYLHRQILKALRSYHGNIHSQIRDLIHEAEILYERGLYAQSEKIIRKVKRIAKDNDMNWVLLEIYRRGEMNLALKKSDRERVEKIMKEESEELSLFQNTKIYRDLYFRLGTYYYRYGISRDKKYLPEIEEIIRNKYLQDESLAKTYEAKLRFYDTHALYEQIKGNAVNTYRYFKATLRHIEQHPQKIKANYSFYLMCLNNVLIACTSSNIPVFIDKLEKLNSVVKSQEARTRLFFVLHYHRLNYFNTMGWFDQSLQAIKTMLSELPLYEKGLNDSEKFSLFIIIAILFFSTDKWHPCIFWLNRIQDETRFMIRPDFESFLRLFYILAHYEAGHADVLPSLIQSFYRFLLKKEQLYKFETALIYFFRNEMPKINPETSSGQKELIQAFQKLKNKIAPLADDAHEKNVFLFFDYLNWLESKIENRSFAEVVRQKAAESGGSSGKG